MCIFICFMVFSAFSAFFSFYYANVFSYFLVRYDLFLSNPTYFGKTLHSAVYCISHPFSRITFYRFYFHFFLSNMHLYRADLRRRIPANSPLFQAFQHFRRRMPVPVVFAAGNQDKPRLCQIQQRFSRRVGGAVVPGVEDGAAEGILCRGMG